MMNHVLHRNSGLADFEQHEQRNCNGELWDFFGYAPWRVLGTLVRGIVTRVTRSFRTYPVATLRDQTVEHLGSHTGHRVAKETSVEKYARTSEGSGPNTAAVPAWPVSATRSSQRGLGLRA